MPPRGQKRGKPASDVDFLKALGARIRAARERAGLSQMDLVRHHGWSVGHVGKIERGEVDVRASTLKRLAADLGVQIETVFKGL